VYNQEQQKTPKQSC